MAWVSEFLDLITSDPRFGYRSLLSSGIISIMAFSKFSLLAYERSVGENEELECTVG
jgi:hypothetical protein